MVCKYCGKETTKQNGICPACEYRLTHPVSNNSEDIYSSSGAAEKEQTFHIERTRSEEFPEITKAEGEVPLYAVPSVSAKKRKLSIKGKAIIIIGSILVLAVVLVAAGVFTSPSAKILKALKGGQYETAYSTFLKSYNNSGSDVLNAALKERMAEVYTLFGNGEMEYTAAVTELETIKKMGIGEIAKDLEDTQKNINKLKTSKDSFITAEKYYDAEKFSLAIPAYKKVIVEDSNYKTAQDRLKSSIQKYRNTALSEASVYASDGDYAAGVKTLKAALATLEKDTLIEKRIAEYQKSAESKGRAEIISVADKYAYKGDYEAAIKAIKAAYKTNAELKDDKTLSNNLKYYTEKYIEKVTEEAGELIDEGEYTAASKLLKSAEDLVGEQTSFTDIRKGLQNKMPVYLDKLATKDQNKWNYKDDATLDSFGNDRADEENCIKLESGSYAVYDITEGYEFFSCYVAAAKDIDEAVKCRIKATATVGGETRFRECEISADTEAQELKFNVSDCTELKIEVSGEGASVIMYNASLQKPQE